MRSLARKALAVVAGFVAASLVMMAVESLNGHVFYPELGSMAQGVTDRETVRAILANARVGAFVVVIFGWALGSFVGGFLAARVGGRSPLVVGAMLGLVLTLAGIADNLVLPPPAWFWLPSLAVLLPAACVGAALKAARATRPPARV
jgi:MFS family permease